MKKNKRLELEKAVQFVLDNRQLILEAENRGYWKASEEKRLHYQKVINILEDSHIKIRDMAVKEATQWSNWKQFALLVVGLVIGWALPF